MELTAGNCRVQQVQCVCVCVCVWPQRATDSWPERQAEVCVCVCVCVCLCVWSNGGPGWLTSLELTSLQLRWWIGIGLDMGRCIAFGHYLWLPSSHQYHSLSSLLLSSCYSFVFLWPFAELWKTSLYYRSSCSRNVTERRLWSTSTDGSELAGLEHTEELFIFPSDSLALFIPPSHQNQLVFGHYVIRRRPWLRCHLERRRGTHTWPAGCLFGLPYLLSAPC